MWSKQADVRNANMTSFKNKITNRKQKNGQPTETAAASPKSDTDAQQSGRKQQKAGKHRNRGKVKPSGDKVLEQTNVDDEIISTDDLDGTADVTMRTTSVPAGIVEEDEKNLNKRYSDSYVIVEQQNGDDNKVAEDGTDKAARRSRRFSDLFRSGPIKTANSMENLNLRQPDVVAMTKTKGGGNKVANKTSADKVNAEIKSNKRNSKKSAAAATNKTSTLTKEGKNAKNAEKTEQITKQPTDSYLKRVKSKIYKNKTETCNSDGFILPSKTTLAYKKGKTFDKIPEDRAVTTKPAQRRSLMDFGLIRQTSNLEQVRSKTFGLGKSAASDVGQKPPVLMKAKSSSAINLNPWKAHRNRLFEQIKDKNCKDVVDEFDFIAFGFGRFRDKFGGSQRVLQSITDDENQTANTSDLGESKPSQPVSRSGSDRRPDVVREEISRNLDGAAGIDHHGHEKTDSNATTPDGATNHPQSSGRKKPSSHINRSESYKEQTEKRKQKRNISDPIPNTISGDVDFEHHGLSNTESGSSSNSSISYNGRLSESPSNSADAVVTDSAAGGTRNSASDWESEPEVQPSNVSQEEMRNLSPHEKERQDVINELFHTENTHVRSLRVLYEIFYKNIEKSQTLKAEELSLIFPNINEVLNVHKQLNKEMKKKRQEDPLVGNLGDMLIGMFGGATGETVRKAAAVFCERQQLALEFIKDKRKKDSKFDMVLAECEKKRQCRRLPFQGIVPTEMQRLSKYPLLLKRLISSIEANPSDTDTLDELGKLKKAHELTKDILNYVNEAAKLALNRHRLEDIQRHLDQSNFERMEHPLSQEYRTLDLTKYKLIHEGLMHLRRPNKGPVPVHILLLEEAVVILQKEGDKFLLKYFQSGSQAQPQPLSPIIKMSTLLVRNNAVCKNALFLVNTSANNSQMYDLLAEDDSKRDMWIKYFADAAESHNKREGKTKRSEPPPDSDESETVQELVDVDLAEKAETVPGDDDEEQHFSDAQDEQPEIRDSSEGGGIRTRVTADEWPLIQPSQVHVQVPPVHTAESRLTPLEQIRRKDEEVRRALEDKEGLVADLLSIPREHFQVIADMAGDTQDSRSSRDISELVMASVYQVNQLHAAVNEALNVTEAAPVVATGGKLPACQSQETMPTVAPPSIAAHVVRDIANKLSSQLTTLLSDVKKVEEERDRFRKELHRLRETLHESESLHGPNNCGDTPSPSPEVQQDLDNSKDSPTNKES